MQDIETVKLICNNSQTCTREKLVNYLSVSLIIRNQITFRAFFKLFPAGKRVALITPYLLTVMLYLYLEVNNVTNRHGRV